MSDMTPGQQAQQNNRDGDGQYAEKRYEEQTLGHGGVDLTGSHVAPDHLDTGAWSPERAVETYRNDITAWRTANTQIEAFAAKYTTSEHFPNSKSPRNALAANLPRMIKTIWFTPEGKRAREHKRAKSAMDLRNLRAVHRAGMSHLAKTDEDRAYFGAMLRAELLGPNGPRVPMQYDRATGYHEPVIAS